MISANFGMPGLLVLCAFARTTALAQEPSPSPAPLDCNGGFRLEQQVVSPGGNSASSEDALAAGDREVVDMAPNSSLSSGAAAGARTLTITSAAELGMTGDFFARGDVVALNPGGANEEIVPC